ncbi:MAG: prenyltransferase/squalene oxidase repeat-containing protein [Phycisphaerae bacterium]
MNSLRDRLLHAAGRVARARPAVAARAAAFVRARACPGGGFADRSGRPDLYYTVFGLQTLAAVGRMPPEPAAPPFEPGPEGPGHLHPAWHVTRRMEMTRRSRGGLERHSPPRAAPLYPPRDTRAYLATFNAADLDLVHLCCLLRCRALLSDRAEADEPLVDRLETFRAADGGYSHVRGADRGTAYGAFLALGAHEDAGAPVPDPDRLADSVAGLRAADGGYAGAPAAETGLVPSTAAAVVTLAALGRAVDAAAVAWLTARQGPTGGWPAAPAAPTADLLSTATALHALAAAGGTLDEPSRAACRTFVESLAEPADAAGFRGHPDDAVADCEYTFYGLLALGHLT